MKIPNRPARLNRVLMRLLSGRALLAVCSVAAAPAPDIAWSTNAHARAVRSLAFSGNSQLLASGAFDYKVQLWSLTNRTLLRTFLLSNQGSVLSVGLSSDNALVGAGDGDGKSRVWRISDGRQLWVYGVNNELAYSVCFSPDGTLLGVGRTDGIDIRQSLTGVGLSLDELEMRIYEVCFSPDGTLLASANQNHNASLWRVPQGTLARDLVGHSNAVTSVSFSPDGALLATASSDGTVRLWRVCDGTSVRVIEGAGGSGVPYGSGSTGIVRFSADGKSLLTSARGDIRFWRVLDGSLLLSYRNLSAGPIAVAPNGKYFAYGEVFPCGTGGTLFLARMPLLISEVKRTDQDLHLDWQGGTGWYQVQQTTSLTSGVWMNLGAPTDATSTNVPISGTNTFFRIQGLTDAP